MIERIGEGGTFKRVDYDLGNIYEVSLLVHFADGKSEIFETTVDDDCSVDDVIYSIDADCEMNCDPRVTSYEICF